MSKKTKTIMDWKKEQLNKYFDKREHIYETEEQFIIVFDSAFVEINIEIEKSELNTYQSVISKILDINKNEHERLHEVIYKELLKKMNEYVKDKNYDFLKKYAGATSDQNTSSVKSKKIA